MRRDGGDMAYFEELKAPLVCEGCGRVLYAKGMWNKLRAAKNHRQGPANTRIRSYTSHVGICCQSCGRDWDVRVLFIDRFEAALGRSAPKDGYQIFIRETAQSVFDRVIAGRANMKLHGGDRAAESSAQCVGGIDFRRAIKFCGGTPAGCKPEGGKANVGESGGERSCNTDALYGVQMKLY